MTARRAHDPLAEARAGCRRAFERAKAAGGLTALTAERLYAETLTLQADKRRGTAAEMFERTRMVLELLYDRSTWPR